MEDYTDTVSCPRTEKIWPELAPSRQSGIGGGKGHNMNETSFARIALAAARPGSPGVPAPS